MDLTIIIPTFNRTNLLRNCLNYYHTINFGGKILIIDSSDDLELKQNKKNINNFNNLNITHKIKKTSIMGSLKYAVNYVETNYLTQSGDDDFIVPDSAKKCIEFLNSNKDYILANGKTILTILDPENKKILDTCIYNNLGCSINNETAIERLNAFSTNYQTLSQSICRTEIFKIAINKIPLEENFNLLNKKSHEEMKYIIGELQLNFLLLTFGKIISLDKLFLIRTKFFENGKINNLRFFDSNSVEVYNQFVSMISEYTSQADQTDYKYNYSIVEKYIRMYLVKDKNKNKLKFIKNNIKQNLIKLLKIIKLFNFIKKYKKNDYSLNKILTKDHKFHHDFSIFYKIYEN